MYRTLCVVVCASVRIIFTSDSELCSFPGSLHYRDENKNINHTVRTQTTVASGDDADNSAGDGGKNSAIFL